MLFSTLKVIHARVGWVWLTRLAPHARLVHLFSSKRTFAPHVQSPKFTNVIRDPIMPQNLKPQNLILGASSRFSQKFPPMKITRYTVVFTSHVTENIKVRKQVTP